MSIFDVCNFIYNIFIYFNNINDFSFPVHVFIPYHLLGYIYLYMISSFLLSFLTRSEVICRKHFLDSILELVKLVDYLQSTLN